ncbi:MAG: hypothetical protein LR015_14940 [Verrucomicrobia bacterium]|nr:hypothetical protein [Verrucomicrobiota bacterium]
MSLINEALKRAQTGESMRPAPPGSKGPSAPGTGSPAPNGGNFTQLLILVVSICLVFSAGTALIVWGLTRADPAAEPLPTVPTQTAKPVAVVEETVVSPVTPQKPGVDLVAEPLNPVAVDPLPVEVAEDTSVENKESVESHEPTLGNDPQVLQFLNQIEVRGITGDGARFSCSSGIRDGRRYLTLGLLYRANMSCALPVWHTTRNALCLKDPVALFTRGVGSIEDRTHKIWFPAHQ